MTAGAELQPRGTGEADAMAEPIAVASFKLEALEESRGVVALRIAPRSIAAALKELKDFLLNQPRRPNVVEAGGNTKEKLVLFHPDAVPSLESIPAVCREFADAKEGAFVAHEVVTSYANFTYDEALRRLLPAGVEVPASFETIGHVAHLNLRPPQEPYRLLIAQVMVDKYPAIKVVLHKTGSITNEFRVFSMEVLADRVTGGTVPRIAGASDPALDTSVKQNGCVFALNFGDVYWNSRLEGEHNRLVETKFKTGDVVWDLMAGIGPFAVPAAKQHGCSVHANDLNPRSHHFLVENCKRNKVLHPGGAHACSRHLCGEPPMCAKRVCVCVQPEERTNASLDVRRYCPPRSLGSGARASRRTTCVRAPSCATCLR